MTSLPSQYPSSCHSASRALTFFIIVRSLFCLWIMTLFKVFLPGSYALVNIIRSPLPYTATFFTRYFSLPPVSSFSCLILFALSMDGGTSLSFTMKVNRHRIIVTNRTGLMTFHMLIPLVIIAATS